MSDNTKLIETLRRMPSAYPAILNKAADALEAAEERIEFLEEQDAGLRDDIGNLEAVIKRASSVLYDRDEPFPTMTAIDILEAALTDE